LKSLFRDEQRDILNQVLRSTLEGAETALRAVYENNAPLMRFLSDLKTPMPRALETAAEYALNSNLRRAFAADELDIVRIQGMLEEARVGGVELDSTTLEFTLRSNIEELTKRLLQNPSDFTLLATLVQYAVFLKTLPFQVNLWNVQNTCYHLLRNGYREMQDSSADLLEKLAAELAIQP
jgi:hypothetical protein